MLVDELRMPVPAQEDGEVVEPGHDALEFHAVDQENGHGRLVFPDVVEENILDVLGLLGGHQFFPLPRFGLCFGLAGCSPGPGPRSRGQHRSPLDNG